VGLFLGGIISFCVSLTAAMYYCSEFSLFLLAYLPVLMFAGAYIGIVAKKSMGLGMKAYA